MRIEVHF